jgi:hypothetical protein
MPKTTFKNDLHVTGKLTSGSLGTAQQVALTASATVNATTHAGRVMTIAKADGMTVTLPAATGSGNVYRFLVTTSVTSNNYVFQVTTNDTFVGQLILTSATSAVVPIAESAAGTDDTITMNGTTTGGLIGTYLEFADIATDLWLVEGRLLGSGTIVSTGLLTAAVS